MWLYAHAQRADNGCITLLCIVTVLTAVYMSRNKKVVESSSVFSESLRMKPSHSPQPSTKSPAQEEAVVPAQFGPASEGMTYELCAGIVDKHASLEQIAREELLEETGYDVPLESIQRVTGYHSSIGTSGSYQTLFYCEVTDDMQLGDGGGMAHEGEMIDVVHVPASEAVQFALDDSKSKSSGLCFAFLWFDKTIRPNLTNAAKP